MRRTSTLPRRRFGGYELPIAVAALILLVTGAVSAVVRAQSTSTSPTASAKASLPTASKPTAPKTTVAAPAAWDPKVADIAHFVERRRNLDFKHPVAVEFLASDEFKRKVLSDETPTAKEQAELDNFVASLRALGLVHGPVDLKASESQLADDILGLYSPERKVVYVRGSDMTPDVRETLAHELTHALQDQHFDLNKYDDAPDGVSTGFRALVEADAMRVADSYVDTMPQGDQRALERTRNRQVNEARASNVPDVLKDIMEFPYAFGPAFVTALDKRGGNPTVDSAFRKPPSSEAQIVDPQLYLSGVEPLKVAAPGLTSGQSRLDKPDDFGQVSMLMVLGQRLDFTRVWSGLHGWAGDQYITYRENGRVCIAVDTALKTPGDADSFASVTSSWASAMPTASSTRTGPAAVQLRSCDPGAAAPSQAPPKPSAFDVLAVRGQIIAGAEQAGVTLPVATCAADRILAEAGPAAVGGLVDVNDESDPRVVRLQTIGARAATACARTAGRS